MVYGNEVFMARKKAKRTTAKTVKINCKGSGLCELSKLKIIQGELKTLSPENEGKLRKRIEQYGFDAPFFVWRNKILDGTQRKIVLDKMVEDGWTLPGGKVPICQIKAKNLNDAKQRLLGYVSQYGKLDSNGLDVFLKGIEVPDLGTIDLPDFDFEKFDAEFLNPHEDLTDPDAVPDPSKKPKTKRGDLYRLGEHRLLCGDATKRPDVERVMDKEKADCVFTSPPYAVGIDYGKYKDTIENLRAMLPKLAEMWKTVIVSGGFAVINFGDILSGRVMAKSETPCEYPMALEYWHVFRAAEYVLWSRRVWCKPGAAVGSSRHCINTNRAACNYEHVWTWKIAGTPPVNEQISGKWPSQCGWFDTTHDNHLEIGLAVHGAGMPVAVAERALTWHSQISHVVHEPFSGTGTTIIAAEKLNRKCYGLEIDPTYCDVIVKRWEEFTGKKAKRVRAKRG